MAAVDFSSWADSSTVICREAGKGGLSSTEWRVLSAGTREELTRAPKYSASVSLPSWVLTTSDTAASTAHIWKGMEGTH